MRIEWVTQGVGNREPTPCWGRPLPVLLEHSILCPCCYKDTIVEHCHWSFRRRNKSSSHTGWREPKRRVPGPGPSTTVVTMQVPLRRLLSPASVAAVCAACLVLGEGLRTECWPLVHVCFGLFLVSLGCELLNCITLLPGWEEQLIPSRQMSLSEPDSSLLPGSSPRRAHLVPSHQSSWITSLNQTDILEAIIGLIFSRSRRW